MSDALSRRSFTAIGTGCVLGVSATLSAAEDPHKPGAAPAPNEAPFTRDYAAPSFKPSWKRPQINRLFVQDFVIYAHSELLCCPNCPIYPHGTDRKMSRGGQWSGWQAPQGVQPAPVAALSDICCTSSSSMKRMRMQLSVWYRGTPGTTVT